MYRDSPRDEEHMHFKTLHTLAVGNPEAKKVFSALTPASVWPTRWKPKGNSHSLFACEELRHRTGSEPIKIKRR